MKASPQPVEKLGAAATATKRLVNHPAKMVVNNRPQAVTQRRLQEAADRSGPAKATRATPPATSGPAVAQRTTWTYAKGSWVPGKKKKNDTDGWPAPTKAAHLRPQEGDTYDQNTGIMAGRASGLSHVITKENYEVFGGEYQHRRNTAYGVLNNLGSNNGPHLVAHITKRGMTESALTFDENFNLHTIEAGTAILPSAGQNITLAKKYLRQANVELSKARKQLKILKSVYQHFLAEKENATSAKDKNIATVCAMELNAIATYSLHEKADKEALGGKSEDRHKGINDLEQVITLSTKILQDAHYEQLILNTVDEIGINSANREHLRKYLYDIGRVAVAQEAEALSDVESDDEKFSDLDEEETKSRDRYLKLHIINADGQSFDKEEKKELSGREFTATFSRGKNHVPVSTYSTRGSKRKVQEAGIASPTEEQPRKERKVPEAREENVGEKRNRSTTTKRPAAKKRTSKKQKVK